MPRPKERLLKVAGHAARTVRAYQDDGRRREPGAWYQVPFVYYRTYIKAPILERITSYDEICVSRTYQDGAAAIHGVKVLDRDDMEDEYYLLERLLKMCELPSLRRVIVLTDHQQVYAASEFARMMCFLATHVEVRCRRGWEKDVPIVVDCDAVFVFGKCTEGGIGSKSRSRVVAFNDAHSLIHRCRVHQIIIHPLIGWLGVTPPGRAQWRYPTDCYFCERVRGNLAVTSLINRNQPIVRLVTDLEVARVNERNGTVAV